MNKQHYIKLAKYNVWANSSIINWCSHLSEDQWVHPIESSFPTIKETIIHIIGAQMLWVDRFESKPFYWLPNDYEGTKEEVLNLFHESSLRLEKYCAQVSDQELSNAIHYKGMQGEYTSRIDETLTHVFNHSTYHRGQLVTMIRQVGFKGVSAIDFIRYVFNQQQV